jgi:type IV secretory pathway VirB2 component (pilin)
MSLMHLFASIDLTHISLPIAALMANDPLPQLNKFVQQIETTVRIVGGTVFLIAVAVAGIMRMVAFGNERRVALSNMALTAAVVGLIIMLMATALSKFIGGAF